MGKESLLGSLQSSREKSHKKHNQIMNKVVDDYRANHRIPYLKWEKSYFLPTSLCRTPHYSICDGVEEAEWEEETATLG